MKCITHADIDAAATCARCGAGICQSCAKGTFYQVDNKPLCKKCNCEAGIENNRILKSIIRGKRIKMVIFVITFAIGLASFISNKINGSATFDAVFNMLFFWGIGFIGNFFDKNPDTRSVKSQVKDAMIEVEYPISSLIGKIIGFFIMAVASPIMIVSLFIGINRVTKQIAENTDILNAAYRNQM